MSIAGHELINPQVFFSVLSGPPDVTAEGLNTHLMTFEYLDEANSKPKIQMTFDNSDGYVLGLMTLAFGLKLRVAFGYPGFRSRPMDVLISSIKAVPVRNPQTESPAPADWGIVTMIGHPDKVKLNWQPRSQSKRLNSFKNVRISEVVSQIARDSGFPSHKIFVQPGLMGDGAQETRLPELVVNEHETVESFLNRMAARYGYRFWTRNGEFHWHEDSWKAAQPNNTVAYFEGPDLLEFVVDGDYSMKIQKVTAKSHDIKNHKPDVYILDHSTSPGHYSTIDWGKEDVISTAPYQMVEEAARRLYANQANRWIPKLTLVGNPNVLRNTLIQLANFGPFLDGPWNVVSVRQTIDNGGFTTNVSLKKPRSGTGAQVCRDLWLKGHGETDGHWSQICQAPDPKGRAKKDRRIPTRKNIESGMHGRGLKANRH